MTDLLAELRTVAIYAAAAERCRREALDALREDKTSPSSEAQERALGAAGLGVVALYLVASAAERYCEATNESGPIGRRALADLVHQTRAMRDAVMHWDDKGKRDPHTFLEIDGRGVAVSAPPGQTSATSALSALLWRDFKRVADRLRRWAIFKLDPDRLDIPVASAVRDESGS
jgi:hypothetical protein